jgi:Na+-driven multidrug efflux pump
LPYVCIGIVMMSLYVLLSRNFTSRDRQFINIVAAYTALIGNVSLNLVLIPAYGITGAAMATAASYTLSALMLLVFFVRESGLAWHEAIFLRRSDLAMWKRLLLDAWTDFRPARA